MDRILITGGTGCIGSNLAATLSRQNLSVTILRREHSDLRAVKGLDVRSVIGDITDAAAVRNAVRGHDTVFHTAALVSFKKKDYAQQHEINVVGTRHVVEGALAEGVRTLVHVSSVAAVGYHPDGAPADETTHYNWLRQPGYRQSKLLGEEEVSGGVARGLHAVIVNPSVVVGERDTRFHGGQIVRDIRKGRIPFYIDGGMNVVYVGDVVKGMIEAARRGRTGERYILAGENLTHKDIFAKTALLVGGRAPFAKLPLSILRPAVSVLERACDALGIDPLITADLVEGAGRQVWFSSAKAEKELGYTITPFDEAITAAYRWYVEQGML